MTTLFISHSAKDNAWAEEVHALLSAHGYQALFLDIHQEDGIQAGTVWEHQLYQRLRQSLAVVALCSPDWLASHWCFAEAILARERGKPVFLIAAAGLKNDPRGLTIPSVLKDRQILSLDGLEKAECYRRLFQGLKREGLKAKDFSLPDRPYPGLEAFQKLDAAVYFGRDGEISAVREVLRRRRQNNAHGFVLVLGASGSGKSSLVRAGLLPRLPRETAGNVGDPAWVIVPPVIGGTGMDGLVLAFDKAFETVDKTPGLADIRAALHRPEALVKLAQDLLAGAKSPSGSVLVVIDQLEEIFGTEEGSDARAMLSLLIVAGQHASRAVTVLATMRSDFLNAFQLFEGTAERYEKFTLDPMRRERFGEVIEGPARRFGIDLDPGLSERIAEDTAFNDALPLLAYTLEQLYRRCKPGRLTLKAYEELGGVSGAVKHVADRILAESGFADLKAEDPFLRDLRRCFFSLAQVAEDGQVTRRLAPRRVIPESCQNLMTRFVNQRLLTSTSLEGDMVLSVTHEALFRVWDRLRNWLDQDRSALLLRGQIESAASEWVASDKLASRAWAEERVLDAVHKISRSGVTLEDVRDPAAVNAFLGPVDYDLLTELPGLNEANDESRGSGVYGETWALPLSHQARLSVGRRLALLGDRRKGIGLTEDGLPDIDWVDIPGGTVEIEIQEDPCNPDSLVEQRLKHTLRPFHLGRYPVTICQFNAFLEDCFRDGRLDLPANVPISVPVKYSLPRPRGRYENHPIDSVNWFDAILFCHWLSAKLEQDIYLPHEAEWQLAATGNDPKRLYPWGNRWQPSEEPFRANSFESGLGEATAVGMYPCGVSAYGLYDMAGTLWEVCHNAFEEPDKIELDVHNDFERVLRGGSWINEPWFLRTVDRFWYAPRLRGSITGFRVARKLPPDND